MNKGFKKYYSYNDGKLVENTYTSSKFEQLFLEKANPPSRSMTSWYSIAWVQRRILPNPWSTKMMSWSILSCQMASTSIHQWASTIPTGRSPSEKEVSSTSILWQSPKVMTSRVLNSVALRKAKSNVPAVNSRQSATTATSTMSPRTTSRYIIL